MSHKGQEEHLESCRPRYPSRNRAGKSTMVDDGCDTLGCRDLDDPELKGSGFFSVKTLKWIGAG
jgi:hypothetical protein